MSTDQDYSPHEQDSTTTQEDSSIVARDTPLSPSGDPVSIIVSSNVLTSSVIMLW